MAKKNNNFTEKFRLLCSQENKEKEQIIWSSSDSSDYDNVQKDYISINCKNLNRKRKRKIKNLPNLNITNYTTNYTGMSEKSIIFVNKSPILKSQYNITNTEPTSPILCKNILNKGDKSPIILLKSSPKLPNIKKKLFNKNTGHEEKSKIENLVKRSKSGKCESSASSFVKNTTSLLELNSDVEDIVNSNEIEENFNKDRKSNHTTSTTENESKTGIKETINNEEIEKNCKLKKKSINTDSIRESNTGIKESLQNEENLDINLKLDDSMELLKPTKLDINLVNKVTSFFDSHFSSQSSSQHSINDIPTPKSSKTSDEIEIINSITQSNKNSTESIKEHFDLPENTKKIKYRKDEIGYRLNALLKRHNASFSLWQHERYLATNSNFVIPKQKHIVFQIRNIKFQYGSYLLEAKNVDNENFFILINSKYVIENNINVNAMFKLYEPYRIMDYNKDFKLIINVYKFECVNVS